MDNNKDNADPGAPVIGPLKAASATTFSSWYPEVYVVGKPYMAVLPFTFWSGDSLENAGTDEVA